MKKIFLTAYIFICATINAQITFTINGSINLGSSGVTINAIPGYDASTTLWLNYLSANGYATPSVNTINAVNNFIVTCKTDGSNNWNLLDRFGIIGQDNRANGLVWIKNPSAPIMTEQANGGAVGWSGYDGYFSDGNNSYINSGFNPSTMGVNYTLNSACAFAYSPQQNGDGLFELMGSYDGISFTQLVPHWSAAPGFAYILNSATNNIYLGNTNTIGLFSAVRSSSSTLSMYVNGSLAHTASNTSTSIPNANIYFHAMNLNGTPGRFYNSPISIVGFGSGSIDQSKLYAAIKTLEENIYGNLAAKPIINPFTPGYFGQVGTGSTFNFNADKITVSGGANDLNNFLYYSKYFNDLDNFTVTGDIKYTQAAVNGTGIGFSVFLLNNSQMALNSFNPNAGVAKFTENTNFISNLSSIGTVNVNDVVRLSLNKNANLITLTALDLTTGGAVATYTSADVMSYPFSSNASSCSNYFAIYNIAGGAEIQNFSITTTQVKGGSLFVGDSKTWGSGVGTPSNRFWANGATSLVRQGNAGPGDVTANIVSRLNEIIAYKPTSVILWIGCNDLRFGVPGSTWQANYLNIVSTLQSAGITVYNLLSAPENTQDVTPLNTWINANCTNVIDINTPLRGSGTSLNAAFNSGDGVHVNAVGHTIIYNTIKAAYPAII